MLQDGVSLHRKHSQLRCLLNKEKANILYKNIRITKLNVTHTQTHSYFRAIIFVSAV